MENDLQPRDVVNRLMSRQPSPRMACHEFYWTDTLRNWVAQGYPVDEKGEPADPDEVFDMDMVRAGGWFDVLPLPGVEEIVDESDEWVIKKNGAGASLRFWKNRSGTPEHIAFEMTTPEIWHEQYRPHLLELDRRRINIDEAREKLARFRTQGRWTCYANLFVWENMRQSMGDLCLYESMLTEPEWIHDYNRVYTDFFKRHYAVLFEEAGLPDGVWMCEDLGYKNGTFCSPAVLRELIFPYFREMVDFFHSYGLKVVLHSCGNIEAVLDQIVDAGFDALHPMEVKAGCDVLRFAERYRDKLTFIGGLDIRVLERGDRDEIARETARIIDGMKALNASWLFASDHSISSAVSLDDYKFFLRSAREQMYY